MKRGRCVHKLYNEEINYVRTFYIVHLFLYLMVVCTPLEELLKTVEYSYAGMGNLNERNRYIAASAIHLDEGRAESVAIGKCVLQLHIQTSVHSNQIDQISQIIIAHLRKIHQLGKICVHPDTNSVAISIHFSKLQSDTLTCFRINLYIQWERILESAKSDTLPYSCEYLKLT